MCILSIKHATYFITKGKYQIIHCLYLESSKPELSKLSLNSKFKRCSNWFTTKGRPWKCVSGRHADQFVTFLPWHLDGLSNEKFSIIHWKHWETLVFHFHFPLHTTLQCIIYLVLMMHKYALSHACLLWMLCAEL